jgi:hypothetical protein
MDLILNRFELPLASLKILHITLLFRLYLVNLAIEGFFVMN